MSGRWSRIDEWHRLDVESCKCIVELLFHRRRFPFISLLVFCPSFYQVETDDSLLDRRFVISRIRLEAYDHDASDQRAPKILFPVKSIFPHRLNRFAILLECEMVVIWSIISPFTFVFLKAYCNLRCWLQCCKSDDCMPYLCQISFEYTASSRTFETEVFLLFNDTRTALTDTSLSHACSTNLLHKSDSKYPANCGAIVSQKSRKYRCSRSSWTNTCFGW